MGELQFAVLGPLVVSRDGQPLAVPAGRRRSVLAALLVRAGSDVDPDTLIEAAWGDQLPADPRASLHTVISRLRHLLGEGAIGASPAGYRIAAAGDTLDARRFERLCANAATAGPEDAAQLLDEALALWRGRAYGEFADRDFAEVEARRLEMLHADAQEERARTAAELGDPRTAVQWLDGLLAEQPFREQAVALLLSALHRAGRTEEALARYREHQQRMAEELGLDPSPTLQALQGQLLGRTAPASSTVPTSGNGWLDRSTTYVGRERELAAVVEAVSSSKVVTITGTGGIGKTRLVAEALPAVTRRLGLQAVVVELAPVEPAQVNHAAGTALGFTAEAATPAAMVDRLRARPVVLVLDNCEHALVQTAALAELLARRCPDIRILLTSRNRLGLPAEQVLRLAPLPVPDDLDRPGHAEHSAAVTLLTNRVERAHPGFALTPRNLPAVAEICRRVDGLPLALELAASRIAVLGVDAVREALAHDPGILDESAAGEHPLRSLVDWSCRLLPGDQQDLFAGLAVFSGEFGVAAARGVAEGLGLAASPEATANRLGALVDASLVSVRETADGPRYRLLAVIRAQAGRRLDASGRTDAARRAHAAWIAQLARRTARDFTGRDAGAALRRLRGVQGDIEAALHWLLLADELDRGAAITVALSQCSHWTAPPAMSDLFIEVGERCLARQGSRPSGAVAAAGLALASRGSLERGLELARVSSHNASTTTELFLAHLALGVAALYGGDVETSLRSWQAITELSNLPLALRAEGHSSLALLARYRGDLDLAREESRMARTLAHASGAAPAQAFASYAAGEASVADPDMGTALLSEAAEAAAAIGLSQISQLARVALLAALVRTGDHGRATQLAAPLLDDLRQAAAWPQLWTTVRILAELRAALNHPHEAALLLEAADTHPSAPPVAGADVPRYASLRRSLQDRLGDQRLDLIRSAARSAGHEQVADWAASMLATPPPGS